MVNRNWAAWEAGFYYLDKSREKLVQIVKARFAVFELAFTNWTKRNKLLSQ
jgi:hypothetical protein